MKTIGMIGGMSWESSIEYYRIVNETVKEKLGGLHSAKSVMVSVDFAEIEKFQMAGRWDEATQFMIAAARQIEAGGADGLVIDHAQRQVWRGGDPVELAYRSRPLQLCVLGWALATAWSLGIF